MSGSPTSNHKDFPKIAGQPKPTEPGKAIWTVYIGPNGRMRARCHIAGNVNQCWFDAEIDNPENFCDVALAWKTS